MTRDGSVIASVIANVRIVLPDEEITGSVVIGTDGLIADISSGSGVPPGAIDGEGDILAPGLVEIHTDNLEKHLVPRPTVLWPAFSALLSHDAQVAGAGITTVFDAVALGDRDGREDRLLYLDEAVGAIREGREQGHLRAEHFLHLRCEVPRPHAHDQFVHYARDPSVRIVSLNDHTPGDRQFPDMVDYKHFCITHFGEDPDEFEIRVRRDKELQERYAARHREIISRESLELGFALASHDDATPEHVAMAHAEGATISEFPTTLEAAEAAHAHGMATVMGAPNIIRGKSQSGNIAARDLAERDLLDILSSDYMPVSLVWAPFKLCDDLGWPLWRAMALVTANPARAAGLTDRGIIAPGKRADLIRVRATDRGPVVREVWREGKRIV